MPVALHAVNRALNISFGLLSRPVVSRCSLTCNSVIFHNMAVTAPLYLRLSASYPPSIVLQLTPRGASSRSPSTRTIPGFHGKSRHPCVVSRALTEDVMSSRHSSFTVIYTDGSVDFIHDVAPAAYHIPSEPCSWSGRFDHAASSTTAELSGIQQLFFTSRRNHQITGFWQQTLGVRCIISSPAKVPILIWFVK